MSQYKRKFNPIPNTSLVPVNTAIRMRDTVASQANLPLSGNVIGDGRVTIDTGHLYVWSLDNSTGFLTDWVDQGNFIDVSWDSLSGKPSSSVTNIDDAVSKRHTQNTDTKLDNGGANEVTAANAKSAVDLKHTQGTDQGLDTGGLNATTASQVKQAVTDDHTHSNKSILDNIQEALTTALKSAYDGAVSNSHAPHSDDQVIPDQLSDLSDDATHRLVTDTEKSTWNGKQDALGFTPVPNTRQVNGHQLSSDVTVSKSDVGLSDVPNLDTTNAVNNEHTHTNKTILDNIQEALTTTLKSAYDSCVTFIANFALGTPVVDDVLAWNGSHFVPKAQQVTGFKGIDLFLDDTASGILGYFTLANSPNTAIVEQLDNIIVNANTVHGEDYISAPLGGTQIDTGTWQFDIYRYISSGNNSGTTELIFEVYKRTSGGTETLLFTVATGDVDDLTNTLQSFLSVQPAFAINSTDRLLIKTYGHRIEVGNRTISFTHNGTTVYSHIHTPLVLRHNDLAGLQGGTSGEYYHLTNAELGNVQSIVDISLNVMLNAFRIAQIGSLTIFSMVKGFMDEYEDESGVDLINSLNLFYNFIEDYISPEYTDFGLTWTDLGQQYGQANIYDTAYCTSDIFIAGTGANGKVLRSVDAGATWTDLGTKGGFSIISKMIYLENGICLASGNLSGLIRSTDYGATWSSRYTTNINVSVRCFAYCGNGIVLAGSGVTGDSHMYRSIDSGATWTDLGVVNANVQNSINTITYLENGILIAGTSNDGLILRSEDFGLTWIEIGAYSAPYGTPEIYTSTYAGGGICLMGMYGNGIIRSEDYGLTWTNVGVQIDAEYITTIKYIDNGIVLAGTTGTTPGKIYRSIDFGLTWTDLGQQYGQASVRGFSTSGNGVIIAGTGTGGKILRSINSSGYDNITIISNAQVATVAPTSARIILFEQDVDSITLNTDLKAYVSRDNGTTFTQVTLADEGNYITGARILSGVVDISAQPSGTNIKYKIESFNNKNLKIHGTGLSWK